jgi:hypothetical protein
MNVAQAVRSRTRVALPAAIGRPFEVYVNGVAQVEGRDYRVVARDLVFPRELRQEGKLGFWRWASLLVGAAGTYRQNDVVDVVYEAPGGRRTVASGLPLEPTD